MIARHRILPLGADDSSRFLPWTIAVMTFLAALAFAGAMAMGSATARWKDALAADLTVQIPPLSDEAADAGPEPAADAQRERGRVRRDGLRRVRHMSNWTAAALLVGVIMTVAITFKAWAEERFLSRELGAANYDAYRRRVPMLVPFLPKSG